MKLDQIAYYAHDENQAQIIREMFGVQDGEWVEDIAKGDVVVRLGEKEIEAQSAGHLRFNYETGIELEILTYLEGPHWHEEKPDFIAGNVFLSHIGFHMEDGERPPAHVLEKGVLVQEMNTHTHTNDYVNSRNRTYHYEIYRMPVGPDLKYIWRIQK